MIAVNSRSGDAGDTSTWTSFPSSDVLIHLAARSFVPDSWADPMLYMRTNLLGTVAALEYCRKHNARLVFMSSYMYGDPDKLPIDEHATLVAKNPYALSKKLAEEACSFFVGAFGVDVIVLRPFNVYGPGQSEMFLVPSIISQVTRRSVISVKDLEPKRDYVYVRDVVDAIASAVNGPAGFNVFNIGSGTSHSVGELIRTVQDVWQTDLGVVSAEERRKDEIMNTVADIREAESQLGWIPRFTLRQGLEDMYRQGQSRLP